MINKIPDYIKKQYFALIGDSTLDELELAIDIQQGISGNFLINHNLQEITSPYLNTIDLLKSNSYYIKNISYLENYYESKAFDYNKRLLKFDYDVFQIENILTQFEKTKIKNETQLSSYQDSFEKKLISLRKKVSLQGNFYFDQNKLPEFLESFERADFKRAITFFSEQDIESISIRELSDLFILRVRIDQVSDRIRVLTKLIKYYSQVLRKLLRNKRFYFRKISSVPFKNLDDYHSSYLINSN